MADRRTETGVSEPLAERLGDPVSLRRPGSYHDNPDALDDWRWAELERVARWRQEAADRVRRRR